MARPVGSKGDKARIVSDAIRIALLRAAKKGKGKNVQAMADKLVELAVDGDVAAIREVADRVDGKPHQTSDINANLSFPPLLTNIPRAGAN